MAEAGGGAAGGGAAGMQFPPERPEQQQDIRIYREQIAGITGRLDAILRNTDLTEAEKAAQIQELMESDALLKSTCERIVLANIDDRLRMNLIQSVEEIHRRLETEMAIRAPSPLPAPAALVGRPGNFTKTEQAMFAKDAEIVRKFDDTRVVKYSSLNQQQKDRINSFIMTHLMDRLRERIVDKLRSLPPRPDPVAEKEFDDFLKIHFQTILRASPALLAEFFGVNENDELIISRKPEIRRMLCDTVIDDMIFKSRSMGESALIIAESLRPRHFARAIGGVMGILIATHNYPVLASLLGTTERGISILIEGAAYSISNYPLATVSSGVLLVVEHEYIYELWCMLRAERGQPPLPFAAAQDDPLYKELFFSAQQQRRKSRIASFVGEQPDQVASFLDVVGVSKMWWWKTKSAVCRSVISAADTIQAAASAPGAVLDFCSKSMNVTRSFLETKANEAIGWTDEANPTQRHSCRLIFSRMADELHLQDDPEVQQTLLNLDKYDKTVILTRGRVEAETSRLMLLGGRSYASPSPDRQADYDETEDSQFKRHKFMNEELDPHASGAHMPDAVGTMMEIGGPDDREAAAAGSFARAELPRLLSGVVVPPIVPPSRVSSAPASLGIKSNKKRGDRGGGKRTTRRKATTKKQKSKKNKRQSRRKARRSSSRKSRK
jgi:hypothetical protein